MKNQPFALLIPFFNFERSVPKTLDRLTDWHETLGVDSTVTLIDDGSTDSTAGQLREFSNAHSSWCRFLGFPKNQGKGAVLRAAFLRVPDDYPWILFTDCDLHYGLDIITERILPALEDGNDIVILDRFWSGRARYVHLSRRAASFIFNRFVSVLTGVNYRDTQAGLKGFRRDTGRLVFDLLTVSRFAFDVEVLSIAAYYRMNIAQIPIAFADRATPAHGSSISLGSAAASMFMNLIKINWNWKRNRYHKPELEERIDGQLYTIRQSNRVKNEDAARTSGPV